MRSSIVVLSCRKQKTVELPSQNLESVINTNERGQVAIFTLDEACAGMDVRTINDRLSKLVDVMGSDGFGECKLASKHWRHADLVRLDVDVGGDDGTCGIVDSFPLEVISSELDAIDRHHENEPSCSFGTARLSFRAAA